MVLAVEHIRRMRGGAQSHLMRCDDGGYYVVKFQNNPQHLRILANEMLAWLGRVERFSRAQLGEIAGTIPPEWYNDEYDQLEELIERLERRRQGVRELIALARDSGRQPFPNWK
jgi:hypothetical protein